MGFKTGLVGVAVAILMASPAIADDLSAELDEVGAQIDEQYMDWETSVRTEILSLYFRALEAQDEGDEDAAAEALAEVRERMGN